MGIIRFFSTIIKQYPDIVQHKPQHHDVILLDFNSIVHDSFATVAEQLSPRNVIGRIFEEVVRKTNHICRAYKHVHIFIDGVPTIAKMMEQKQRRLFGEIQKHGREMLLDQYKDTLTAEEYDFEKHAFPRIVLSRAHIAPQTNFMKQLVPHLKSKINAEFHDDSEPGEAEHKIIRYLRTHTHQHVSVYSPDADMIVLLLKMTDKVSSTLVRKDIRSEEYINISIDKLKSKLGGSHAFINDLCFVYNIFGNDFIPEINNIDVKRNFKRVTLIHRDIVKTHGLVLHHNQINWSVLRELYRSLNRAFKNSPHKNKPERHGHVSDNYHEHVHDWLNFKNRYAANNIYPQDAPRVVNYLLTLRFIHQLYENNDTQLVRYWYYPHKSAPSLQHIAQYLIKHDSIDAVLDAAERSYFNRPVKFTNITPVMQLLYITPSKESVQEIVDVDPVMLHKAKSQFQLNEAFISQLTWHNGLLNINAIVKCGNHIYLNKCYPNMDTVEDPFEFFNKLVS